MMWNMTSFIVYFCTMMTFSADCLAGAWNHMGEGRNVVSKVINKLFTHANNWKFAGENWVWITHLESDIIACER